MSEPSDVRLKGWKPQNLNTSYAKDANWAKECVIGWNTATLASGRRQAVRFMPM